MNVFMMLKETFFLEYKKMVKLHILGGNKNSSL